MRDGWSPPVAEALQRRKSQHRGCSLPGWQQHVSKGSFSVRQCWLSRKPFFQEAVSKAAEVNTNNISRLQLPLAWALGVPQQRGRRWAEGSGVWFRGIPPHGGPGFLSPSVTFSQGTVLRLGTTPSAAPAPSERGAPPVLDLGAISPSTTVATSCKAGCWLSQLWNGLSSPAHVGREGKKCWKHASSTHRKGCFSFFVQISQIGET